MKHMNTARRYASNVRTFAGKAALAGSGLLASGLALAQATDPGAAITTEITNGKTTVNGILVLLAGVVGLFLLWSMIKRAK